MSVFGIKKARDDLAENLGELLLTMELADFEDHRPEWWDENAKRRQFQPLRFLQEVEPIDAGIDPIAAGPTEEILDPDELTVTPSDLDTPLHVATAERVSEQAKQEIAAELDSPPPDWIFDRYVSVPQSIMGKYNDPPAIVIENIQIAATVGADIKYQSDRNFLLLHEGIWTPTIWQDIETGDLLRDQNNPDPEMAFLEPIGPAPGDPESEAWFQLIDRFAKLALARQFARRYQWRVLFRDHPRGTATLALVTDPKGAREAFKLRDKPRGNKRRPALKHWVREHWRATRGGTDSALVKAHLRGETRFTFEGMECLILPSEFDIEAVKKREGIPR